MACKSETGVEYEPPLVQIANLGVFLSEYATFVQGQTDNCMLLIAKWRFRGHPQICDNLSGLLQAEQILQEWISYLSDRAYYETKRLRQHETLRRDGEVASGDGSPDPYRFVKLVEEKLYFVRNYTKQFAHIVKSKLNETRKQLQRYSLLKQDMKAPPDGGVLKHDLLKRMKAATALENLVGDIPLLNLRIQIRLLILETHAGCYLSKSIPAYRALPLDFYWPEPRLEYMHLVVDTAEMTSDDQAILYPSMLFALVEYIHIYQPTNRAPWLNLLKLCLTYNDSYTIVDQPLRKLSYWLSFLTPGGELSDLCRRQFGQTVDHATTKQVYTEIRRGLVNVFTQNNEDLPQEFKVMLEKRYRFPAERNHDSEESKTPWWQKSPHKSCQSEAVETPNDTQITGGLPIDKPITGGQPIDKPITGGQPIDEPITGGTQMPTDEPTTGGSELPAPGGTKHEVIAESKQESDSDGDTEPWSSASWKRLIETAQKPILRSAPRVDQTDFVGYLSDSQFCAMKNVALPEHRTLSDGTFVHNLEPGRTYHTRVYGYNPKLNQWSYGNVLYTICEKLDTDKEGASRDVIRAERPLHGRSFECLLKFQRRYMNHYWETYTQHVVIHNIADYYLNMFKDKFTTCQDLVQGPPIELIMVNVGVVQFFTNSRGGDTVEFASTEYYYLPDDELPFNFIKFTNNKDWVNQHVLEEAPDVIEALLAYSHFTYDTSNGELLVTDHQGWCKPAGYRERSVMLTDPAIHGRKDLFGFEFGNDGDDGIKNFFTRQHPQCNKFCERLGLKRPQK